jgi:hypothetical protein
MHVPARTEPFPAGGMRVPARTEPFPAGGMRVPARTEPFPAGGVHVPARTEPFPAGGVRVRDALHDDLAPLLHAHGPREPRAEAREVRAGEHPPTAQSLPTNLIHACYRRPPMGSPTRPTDAEIKATYKRALSYAMRLTGRKAHASELVQDSIVAALDGPSAWDPTRHPAFDSHVCNLVWSRYGHSTDSYEALHSEGSVTDAHENRRTEALLDPEETLLDGKHEALAAQRTAALDARVADDAQVRLLLDAADADDDSTSRATAAGYSAREIEFARRRLARHIEAVMREFPNPTDDGEDD